MSKSPELLQPSLALVGFTILGLNQEALLPNCLSSFLSEPPHRLEVLVADVRFIDFAGTVVEAFGCQAVWMYQLVPTIQRANVAPFLGVRKLFSCFEMAPLIFGLVLLLILEIGVGL